MGSDVMMVLQWLNFLIPLILKNERLGGPRAQEFVESNVPLERWHPDIRNLHWILQTHGLLLQRACGQRLHQLSMKIAKSYHWLAKWWCRKLLVSAWSHNLMAWNTTHTNWERRFLSCSELCLNPLAFNCEGNEDHVGRVCKPGRSVSTRSVSKRVHQRYFLKTRALIRRHQDSPLKKKWKARIKIGRGDGKVAGFKSSWSELDEGIVAKVVTNFPGLVKSSRNLSVQTFLGKQLSALAFLLAPRHSFWESAEIDACRQARHFILPTRGVPRYIYIYTQYIYIYT